jgi:hypothetical protein
MHNAIVVTVAKRLPNGIGQRHCHDSTTVRNSQGAYGAGKIESLTWAALSAAASAPTKLSLVGYRSAWRRLSRSGEGRRRR